MNVFMVVAALGLTVGASPVATTDLADEKLCGRSAI